MTEVSVKPVGVWASGSSRTKGEIPTTDVGDIVSDSATDGSGESNVRMNEPVSRRTDACVSSAGRSPREALGWHRGFKPGRFEGDVTVTEMGSKTGGKATVYSVSMWGVRKLLSLSPPPAVNPRIPSWLYHSGALMRATAPIVRLCKWTSAPSADERENDGNFILLVPE